MLNVMTKMVGALPTLQGMVSTKLDGTHEMMEDKR